MSRFDRWRVAFDDAAGSASLRQVPNPPGFASHALKEASSSVSTHKRKEADIQKRQQALNSRALAPWKQVGVLCVMMFMSANTIQIFSLLTTFSGIATSLQAILTSKDAFKPDAEGLLDTRTPRLMFCLIHFAAVIFGMYKLNSIGLLPTHASDWFSALEAPTAKEFSVTELL